MISFAQLQFFSAREGLTALAVIDPPAALDPAPLDQMLADGVGDLTWLAEQREKRLNPVAMLPTARSLVVFAWHYQPTPGSGDLRRARYAAGKDYHVILRPKIGRIGTALGKKKSRMRRFGTGVRTHLSAACWARLDRPQCVGDRSDRRHVSPVGSSAHRGRDRTS